MEEFMKEKIVFFALFLAAVGLLLTGCPDPKENEKTPFVAVEAIIDVPETGLVGIPLPLTGTVLPANATRKTIVWDFNEGIADGAVIENGSLLASKEGTFLVTATIVGGLANNLDFNDVFIIEIEGILEPVTSITGIPEEGFAGTPIPLNTAVVNPANATNRTITWSVENAGTTGASITGPTNNRSLATQNPGTVIIKAEIINGLAVGTPYTQNFTIEIKISPVENITGVPETGNEGIALTLSGTVEPANATYRTIVWTVENAGTTGAQITAGSNTLTTTATGTVIVKATIVNGLATGDFTKDFSIEILPPWGGWTLGGNLLGTNATRTGTFGENEWNTAAYQFYLQKNGATNGTLGTWAPAGSNAFLPTAERFTAGRQYALELEFTPNRNVNGPLQVQVVDGSNNWVPTPEDLPAPDGGSAWWWPLEGGNAIAENLVQDQVVSTVVYITPAFTASLTANAANVMNFTIPQDGGTFPALTFTKFNLWVKDE